MTHTPTSRPPEGPEEPHDQSATGLPAQSPAPTDPSNTISADARQPRRPSRRGFAQAARFLLFSQDLGGTETDAAKAARWIVPLGLVLGLIWTAVFRLTWRVYGETANMALVPAFAVVLLECILTGRLLVMGATRTAEQITRNGDANVDAGPLMPLSAIGALVLCMTVLAHWIFLVSLRDLTTWWPSDADPRHYFNFLYPRIIFRPLILAPIWGRWGILLATTVGRPTPHADAATTVIGRVMGPRRLLLQTLLPVILTTIYFSREQNRFIGLVMSLLVFAATFLASVAFARRCGGQTRHTIFAAGLVAQLAFLAIYRAFWPLIYQ